MWEVKKLEGIKNAQKDISDAGITDDLILDRTKYRKCWKMGDSNLEEEWDLFLHGLEWKCFGKINEIRI